MARPAETQEKGHHAHMRGLGLAHNIRSFSHDKLELRPVLQLHIELQGRETHMQP